MSSSGNGSGTAARRLATILGHLAPPDTSGSGSVLRPSPVASPTDRLLENSTAGFAAMKEDGRISDINPNAKPSQELSQMVPFNKVRFSQQSLGSGFSSPPSSAKGVPLAVSLRSANPLSVLTEAPGNTSPSAHMVRNEDDLSLTTFDHRRLVNTALHAPGTQVKATIQDKASIPKREWGKYTTQSRGDSIAILAPGSTMDPRRDLGSLSVQHGPDKQLQASTRNALSHMINRSAVLAELTKPKGTPGQTEDHQRHVARKQEYGTRLSTFEAQHTPKPKPQGQVVGPQIKSKL